jgi:cobalt-zinc-cadmium efflux system outer membrane protein
VAGDLYRRRRVPPFADLVDELEAAPEIVRDMAEKQLREAEVRLADAYRVPTPNVLVGFRRLQANQDETMTAGIFMPLPFSDRNQGNRSAARALLEKSKDTLQATDIRLRTALFKLYQELLHASAALDSLENEILTQAEASLALSRSGFLEGRFTYLDLADAERTLVALKRERIETAASYHQFVLDIERLTGQPLDDTTDKAVLP